MSEPSEAAKAKACELLGVDPMEPTDFNQWRDGCYAHAARTLARFIQQANDAAKEVSSRFDDSLPRHKWEVRTNLAPFILPEPVDPLVEAMDEVLNLSNPQVAATNLRLALAKRDLKIVEARP